MHWKFLSSIMIVIGLFGCSSVENITLANKYYVTGDINIYLLEYSKMKGDSILPTMQHGALPTIDFKFIPFLLKIDGRNTSFLRYCDPIEYQGNYEPMDENKILKMTDIEKIKKSCKIDSISEISKYKAGTPWSFLDDSESFINFWIYLPIDGSSSGSRREMRLPLPECC